MSYLPVAVIGAGPVGLAAAAHLVQRGETPVVFESGATVGANLLEWGHVQLFSPWQYNIDSASAALLQSAGWRPPAPDAYPTGRDLVERYLAPLAALPAIRPHLRFAARVTAVTRLGRDKMKTPGREQAPFLLRVETPAGEQEVAARAVIDASGTYQSPNPLGASGLPAIGERQLASRIFYGIPDALGAQRARYAGKRVLVVGSGHSAFNALLDLLGLSAEAPGTEITWAVRRAQVGQLFGGGANDLLPARGELGLRLRQAVDSKSLRMVMGVNIHALRSTPDGIVVDADDQPLDPVDEIVAATGFRPDLAPLSELRLGLDPAVESPVALAPLIDPNLHSCGTVRPHGAEELAHPEPGFYIVGMKSYGRAPTFLLLTGYEQVRSVVAALAGDWEAARQVELVLPETGVCSGPAVASGTSQASSCGPTASVPLLASANVAFAPAASQLASCCAPSEQADCCGGSAACGC